MKVVTIVKRGGDKEKFDISKIKKAINWACEGINVNPLELESNVHLNLHDDMSTTDIQKVLIDTAIKMTNVDDFKNLDWRYVAARLLLLNVYKEARIIHQSTDFHYGNYYEFIKSATEEKLYDLRILNEYSKEEIQEIEKELNPEYDLLYDYAGMNLLKKRYLLKKRGFVFEKPQEMFLSLALLLAVPETRRFGKSGAQKSPTSSEKEDRMIVAKQIYHTIASKKVSLATPILLNLRRPEGNLASCFITSMDDDLSNIYNTLDQVAQISKNAGGVGVNISRIRSQGAYIKHHKGASGGILPWVKLLNDTAVAVDQLGSRSGAVTVALDIWHRDLEEFLEMQTENGDFRKKSFDVFPQIVISDLFMKKVKLEDEWCLFDPNEIRKKYGVELAEIYGEEFEDLYEKISKDKTLEFKKSVNAKNLFKKILRTVVETGMPYIFFKDTVNKFNPNKHEGMIGNANLCVESFSNFKPTKVSEKRLEENKIVQDINAGEVHTCNLVSLNLPLLNDEKTLESATKLSVRILDNTIELTKPPIPESEIHNNKYRIIGIGSMGLADYLAVKGIVYEKANDEVSDLFERIAIYGIEGSAEIAKIRSSYPAFKGSQWDKGIFFGKTKIELLKNSNYSEKWAEVIKNVEDYGLRNGGLFAIAPNTSTSLLCGVTPSVLPIYKKFYVDKSSSGAVPICPPYLSQKTFWTYKENQHIDQNKVIDVVSKIQEWTDQGISMELVLNLNMGLNAKSIYDFYMNAWQKNCKAVYYIRSITKDANKISDCVSCAN